MLTPEFSIIICTYERHQDLIESVKSVFDQKFKSYELIVVVPYHDKKSISILKQFQKTKIVLQKEGKGLSFARNLGIAVAKGKFIAFLDDDANAYPDWLNNLHRCYTDDAIGAVGGLVISPNLTDIQFKNGTINKFVEVKAYNDYSHEEYNHPDGVCYNYIQGTNTSFRRNLLVKLGGFNPAYRFYLDETELCVRIIKEGFKIIHANDAIVVHKMSEGINRKSRWDQNWFEIMKSTIYFSMSHFYSKSNINDKLKILYYPLSFRFREFYGARKNKQLSTSLMLRITFKTLRGFFKGLQEYKNVNQQTSWIPSTTNLEVLETTKQKNYLRICLVSQQFPPDSEGGNARHTHILSKKLVELGHTVHVIASGDKEEFYDGVQVHRVPPKKMSYIPNDYPIVKRNLEHSFAVHQEILEINDTYGLDIIEFVLWDSEGFVFSLFHNIPYVVRAVTPIFKVAEIHNWELNEDLLMSIEIEKKFLKQSDGIIAISEGIQKTVSQYYNLEEKKWFFGPLGIPFENPSTIETKDHTILFVGRLEPRKGVDTIMKSIPKIVEKYKDVKFLFVGIDTPSQNGKSYKDYLISLLDKKYHNNIEFLGFVEDSKLQELYSKCSIFVAPSIYESFGIIFLEAMRESKPIIGTNVGGIPEIIDDGENGFLIEPHDFKSLSKKLEFLLDNPKEMTRLGKNGRKKLEKVFSTDSFANKTLEIYKKTISSFNNS